MPKLRKGAMWSAIDTKRLIELLHVAQIYLLQVAEQHEVKHKGMHVTDRLRQWASEAADLRDKLKGSIDVD